MLAAGIQLLVKILVIARASGGLGLGCLLSHKRGKMICPTCQTDSTHIKIIRNRVGCHKCMGFSETSKTDKVLTYVADRITEQQVQYEGDMITPYVVDKSTNNVIVNESFVDAYPEQSTGIFTREELGKAGYEELKPPANDDNGEGITFSGDQEESIREILDEN